MSVSRTIRKIQYRIESLRQAVEVLEHKNKGDYNDVLYRTGWDDGRQIVLNGIMTDIKEGITIDAEHIRVLLKNE